VLVMVDRAEVDSRTPPDRQRSGIAFAITRLAWWNDAIPAERAVVRYSYVWKLAEVEKNGNKYPISRCLACADVGAGLRSLRTTFFCMAGPNVSGNLAPETATFVSDKALATSLPSFRKHSRHPREELLDTLISREPVVPEPLLQFSRRFRVQSQRYDRSRHFLSG